MTVPQVIAVWAGPSVEGVSLVSWVSYLVRMPVGRLRPAQTRQDQLSCLHRLDPPRFRHRDGHSGSWLISNCLVSAAHLPPPRQLHWRDKCSSNGCVKGSLQDMSEFSDTTAIRPASKWLTSMAGSRSASIRPCHRS